MLQPVFTPRQASLFVQLTKNDEEMKPLVDYAVAVIWLAMQKRIDPKGLQMTFDLREIVFPFVEGEVIRSNECDNEVAISHLSPYLEKVAQKVSNAIYNKAISEEWCPYRMDLEILFSEANSFERLFSCIPFTIDRLAQVRASRIQIDAKPSTSLCV